MWSSRLRAVGTRGLQVTASRCTGPTRWAAAAAKPTSPDPSPPPPPPSGTATVDVVDVQWSNATQGQLVAAQILQEDFYAPEVVEQEVAYYFNKLGIAQTYFLYFSPRRIANHLLSLMAAKRIAKFSGHSDVEYYSETDYNAVYCCAATDRLINKMERRLVEYIRDTPEGYGYSINYFRSEGPISPDNAEHLGLFIVTRAPFPKGAGEEDTAIQRLSTAEFMRTVPPRIRARYADLLKEKQATLTPVTWHRVGDTGIRSLMIAFNKRTRGLSYMIGLSEVVRHLGITVQSKFVEKFANGVRVYTLYMLNCTDEQVRRLEETANLLDLLPNERLLELFYKGKFSAEELMYSHAAVAFAYYFGGGQREEYRALKRSLKDDTTNLAKVKGLAKLMRSHSLSLTRVYHALEAHPKLTKAFYADFAKRFHPSETDRTVDNEKLLDTINKSAENQFEADVLQAVLLFNQTTRKTNFFKPIKAAVSFRMDPEFLARTDYPDVPYGVCMVVGSDFLGFHIRFREISRGGIRLIRSPTDTAYQYNLQSLFTETYGLAFTQQKKNKDIPEGGSKGSILLPPGYKGSAKHPFDKYIDGLLDLLLENPNVVDGLGKQEILFCGPDEGTADYMESASAHAKRRGYAFWRAFTTGKPPAKGGIPHDTYGMTTQSVHRYVTGVLDKWGWSEEEVTKVQTGGPDGDLGSNEILFSKDKTIAIVDGSGVIYDPVGLNRTELVRLATERLTVDEFDTRLLGEGGFKVLLSDEDRRLPSGEVVENGIMFRNSFHLHPLAKADLFVPCGGRPEAVNMQNIHSMFLEDGSPKFKVIVEGANLFITEDARLQLERAGVTLFKDASTNKGGVTSSSLEVLAALSMPDQIFNQLMAGSHLPYYQEYVKAAQEKIVANAEAEFECIWRESDKSGTLRTHLTNQLSNKINSLNDQIRECESLWANKALVNRVMAKALPEVLIANLGLEAVMERVPDAYLRSIFGSYLASQYVYQCGFGVNEAGFWSFMREYGKKE